MSSTPTTLVVIAKEPVPGKVKTRLSPAFTPQQAARLAEASLRDTLDVVAATPVDRRVLCLAGEPGSWLPEGFEVIPQATGGLDERLAAVFEAQPGPTVLIGMDTPQVSVDRLRPALDFSAADAWFGPASDGGFWLLGLAKPDPELLRGVPMSTSYTGREQHARLTAAGLRVRELPELRDVDTEPDANAVAASAPGSHFAATLAQIQQEAR